MNKITLNKNTAFLHFEDNEVKQLDENKEVIETANFNTPEEAFEVFGFTASELTFDPNYCIERVHYEQQLAPRRLSITRI